MKKLIVSAFLVLSVLSGAASCPPGEPVDIEVEDCDAEDFRNKESECGFSDADRKKTKAPAPKTTKRRP